MPSWDVHRRVYELLGLPVSLCGVVDRVVDVEPPRACDVVAGEVSEERLSRHFGYRKVEFPLMWSFIVREYGFDGARCLLVHFVLDFVEELLVKGYPRGLLWDCVEALLGEYGDECRVQGGCAGFDGACREVLEGLRRCWDEVVDLVAGYVEGKLVPVDRLACAAREVLSFIVRVELWNRGFRGRSPGFSVDRGAYRRAMMDAERRLRIAIYEAAAAGRICVEESLEGLSYVKRGSRGMTISEYSRLLREAAEKYGSFKELLEVMKEVASEAVGSLTEA